VSIIRDVPIDESPLPAGAVPDYELADSVIADGGAALKALADTTRVRILDLVLERAATVTELAAALGRPKSSVAYHVDTLVAAGLLRVVRTRKVRAIDERFYGRTGRTIVMGAGGAGTHARNFLGEAINEASSSGVDALATLRHARIPEARAEEFFERVVALAEEFTRLPRGGDMVFGFVASVYPTDHPTLPNEQSS
jgi:DNA-binding transcriptional ArsR family regulator